MLVVVHVEKHSGPQRSLEPRIRLLAERGARITALVPERGPAAEVGAELGDVRTGGPGALLAPRGPRDAARLPALIRHQARAVDDAVGDTGAELVVVSSALLPGAVAGARRAGAAVVLYSGELLADGGVRGLAKGLVARYSGRRAGAVLACSRAVADSHRRRGVEAAVIYPPIEAPADRQGLAERGADLRRDLGLGEDERLVCSLGAITAGRGQDTLVEALAASLRHGAGWHLAIAGEAYERPLDAQFERRLRALIDRLGVSGRVSLAGRLDDPQALYAAADLFVNPARAPEAFGRAACEALAAGCPVVSTRVGGTAEALRDGETALLVEPDDPDALAAAIERLLDDRELAERLARAGADDVTSRFAPAVGEPTFTAAVARALAARSARR